MRPIGSYGGHVTLCASTVQYIIPAAHHCEAYYIPNRKVTAALGLDRRILNSAANTYVAAPFCACLELMEPSAL